MVDDVGDGQGTWVWVLELLGQLCLVDVSFHVLVDVYLAADRGVKGRSFYVRPFNVMGREGGWLWSWRLFIDYFN